MSDETDLPDEEAANSDDEVSVEFSLTPQQHADISHLQTHEMRRRLAAIAQASHSASGIADIQRRLTAQLPFAEIAANLSQKASLIAAQAGLAASMSIPALDSNATWARLYSKNGINSDIFKTYALVQPNLANIAARLVANSDLGQGIASKALVDLARIQTSWLGSISEDLARIQRGFYPPNLRDIDDISIELVERVVMVDGIALYGVPRTSVAQALLHADGAPARRRILGRRWKQISADCHDLAERIPDCGLQDYSTSVRAALDALDAGHAPAAQALAATIVDTILRRQVPNWVQYTPARSGNRTTEKFDELNTRLFIAFAPIWQAYQVFDAKDVNSIPTVFSRHASAHSVGRRQFNRRNALQGILLACGLLYRLAEQPFPPAI